MIPMNQYEEKLKQLLEKDVVSFEEVYRTNIDKDPRFKEAFVRDDREDLMYVKKTDFHRQQELEQQLRQSSLLKDLAKQQQASQLVNINAQIGLSYGAEQQHYQLWSIGQQFGQQFRVDKGLNHGLQGLIGGQGLANALNSQPQKKKYLPDGDDHYDQFKWWLKQEYNKTIHCIETFYDLIVYMNEFYLGEFNEKAAGSS